MNLFIKMFFLALCISGFQGFCQVNRSQASNYQGQKTSFHNYASNYQKGFVQLLDGTRLEGEISIIGNSYEYLYGVNIKMQDGTKYKFPLRSLIEFGLSENLINDTPGEFSWYTVDKVKLGSNTGAPPKPSNTRKGSTDFGYVVTKEGKTYQGKINIKEVRKKIIQIDVKTPSKEKFKFEASQLSNFGVGLRNNDRVADVDVSKRSNNKVPYYDDNMLNTSWLNDNVNGYVIDADARKIMGKIGISTSPNLWFIRHITLTEPNGETSYFSPSDMLKKIVKVNDGVSKEYIYFEGEYVEVLHRDGWLVHFRNPHPKTLSVGGDLANVVTGAAMESADQDLRAAGGSITKNDRPNKDVDWTSEEVIKLYAQEFLLLNELTGKYAMYIPGRKYWQIEGDLMGSLHYLKLPKEGQDALRKMEKPSRTMYYLNEKIYSR
ncbi:MAG: hypothetical protein ABJF11_12075 [Reichenbachiella sp.]|uniref:hypothetical protein n=1 Tax=Reichenbachiella sp. TaxID=2184521 RepID=UPI0032670FE9